MANMPTVTHIIHPKQIKRSLRRAVEKIKTFHLTSQQKKLWSATVESGRKLIRNPLFKVVVILLLALLVGGQAILWAEHSAQGDKYNNLFTAMYWALVSMTTVGYGDIAPITMVGRVIAMLVILCGVVLISFFTATVSSVLVTAKIREGSGLDDVHLKNHMVICGWSRIAEQLLDTLASLPTGDTISAIFHQRTECVLIGELDPVLVTNLLARYKVLNLHYVRGNWTDEAILKRASVQFAQTVVLLPDESLKDVDEMDKKTILSTLSVKALNHQVRLVTHIMKPENKLFLERAQADDVLLSDEFTGYLLASHTLANGIPYAMQEMLSGEGSNRLSTVQIPTGFRGKTVGELTAYYANKRLIFIGLSRQENPLAAADILSADSSALDDFIRRKFEEARRDTLQETRTKVRLNPSPESVIHEGDLALVLGDTTVL